MFKKRSSKFIFLGTLFLTLSTVIGVLLTYGENESAHFISTNDPIPFKRLKHECCRNINREGLSDLNAYGSGVINYRFFKKYFAETIKPTGGELYIVNLLNQDVYYYNDRPLRWYGLGFVSNNLGKNLHQKKIFRNAHKGLIRLVYGTPPINDISQLQTERSILSELGIKYFLFPYGNDGWLNNEQFLENTIHFFESIPDHGHLYIHCQHGRGRTTTVLVLYDIFKNAKKMPLKDITDRQYCLGREDLMNTILWPKGTWTQEALDARKELVEKFYEYMTDSQGYGYQSWSRWVLSKGSHNPKKLQIHRQEEKIT